MGRHYWGNIKGKFWFGKQCSNDAENFGEEPNFPIHYCYTCGCEDYEEFHDDEDVLEGECETCGCEYDCEKQDNESELEFYFNKDNVNDIQAVLDEIKAILPDIPIPVFTKIDDGETVPTDDYECELEYQNDEHEDLQARWCLGHQILACIEDNDECNFTCEV
jgi:hypothetical protein